MLNNLYFILSAFILFVAYNSVVLGLFGVPESLSETYYLFENRKKNLGWIFTGFMFLMAFSLIPGFLNVSDAVGPWMNYFTFLAFFTVAAIAFVGASPHFHEGSERTVHQVSATVCAVSALLWDFIVCWNIWWLPLCVILIPIALGFITKTWKNSFEYWLEMMAFDATFATIIGELIVQMNK